MPKSSAIGLLVVCLAVRASSPLFAQQAGTIPQFSTVETHEYDTINLGTLGIQLNAPIRSKAGHIPYSYRLVGASQIKLQILRNGNLLQSSSGLGAGEAHVAQHASYTTTTNCSTGQYESGFYVSDANGVVHTFTFVLGSSLASCPHPSSNGGYATDNSGLYLWVTGNCNGYTCTPGTYTLHDISGNSQTAGATGYFTAMTDPDGNSISASTDTLGQTAMTTTGVGNGGWIPSSGATFTWTDALGNNQTDTLTMSSPITIWTAFGCSADGSPLSNGYLPSSMSFPDGSSLGFTWEKSPLNSSDYTGRIASVKLSTGGTISYAYSGGTNGINCFDGTPATMTRTTPDGRWVYTHVPPSSTPCGTNAIAKTTVQDPLGNNSVYTFNVGTCLGSTGNYGVTLEAEKQVYNGSVAPANLSITVITCYNNTSSTPTNCPGSAPVAVTEKDVYTTYPGVMGYSAVKTSYDTYGRVSEVKTYDFGLVLVSDKVIQYGTGSPTTQSCTAISTYIIDKPCSVTLKDSSANVLSQTWNSYDSKGNLLQTWNLVSGSGSSGAYLSKQYTYDSRGVVQTMTDVNGQVMNYTTTSCNNMFVTSQYPSNFTNLQTSQTWDCNGSVMTSSTDANGQTTHDDFYVGTATDPFYRPLDTKDELGYTTTFTYTPNSTEGIFLFNNGTSVIDTLSTTDSIGRPVVAQLKQQPGSSVGPNWDTRSRTFDSDGRLYQTSLPCVSTAGAGCSASTESQTYDALNRPLVHTGTGGDIITKSYPANDILTKLTPVPANENAKQTQKEYDGLGRLKSVCVISSAPGSASCGQTTAATGFLTTYSYDGAGRLLQSIENAQSSPQQKRTYTYDKLGRMLSETNPEQADSYDNLLTTTYTYDSVTGTPPCPIPTGMTLGSNGDLVEKVDPNGNTTCYFYDELHRNVAITYNGPNNNGVNKYFVYDAATVNGSAMANAEGRIAEAYTCSGATLPCSSKITDEGYSYDARGLLSDYYQKSANSGGWYHLSASHWEDKQVKAVSGVGLPTITFGASDGSGLDGEGRVTKVNASSGTNPVSGVTYNNGSYTTEPIGSLLTVTVGAGDAQNFTYDKNTGRMKSYSASVGSTPTVITGSLNWNANGTLAENSITDGWNSANTQDCKYLYDDFIRVASGLDGTPGVNCVNGSTKVWNQTFTYDSFGNITKSTTGPGASWACAACYDTATNHYNNVLSGSITYDLDGNLTYDTFHSYTWLSDGHVATIDSNTITYDANGGKVEENVGGTIHEYVSAFGVSAQMTGQTENSTLVDLPGGVQALYSGSSLQRFRFPDWQVSVRAESNASTRVFTESLAFAPFGERYAQKGTPFNVDSFTGKPDQIVGDEYDFPAREQHGGQGRWVSPDPMRGTGNKYVYADNNPLSKVDLYGMYAVVVNGIEVADVEGFPDAAAYHIAYAESHPPSSTQTDGQTTTSSSGNGSSSPATQTAASQQAAQTSANTAAGQPVQQAQQAQQQAQNQTGAVNILGQNVPYTIAQGAPTNASTALNKIVATVNGAQDQLTPAQVTEIKAVKALYIAAGLSDNTAGGESVTNAAVQRQVAHDEHINVPIGTYIINGANLSHASTGYWASSFVHEGVHMIHQEFGTPSNERRAYFEQYRSMPPFHVTAGEGMFIKAQCGADCY